MSIPAGFAKGTTGRMDHAQLSALARAMQGQPQGNAVPTPGESTDGGLDVTQLLAQIKNGQVAPQAILQILALLSGMGAQPPGMGDMSAIQNAGQGGPPGPPQGAASPIMAAMLGGAGPMGAGPGGQ